jgi:hypothetical protein
MNLLTAVIHQRHSSDLRIDLSWQQVAAKF